VQSDQSPVRNSNRVLCIRTHTHIYIYIIYAYYTTAHRSFAAPPPHKVFFFHIYFLFFYFPDTYDHAHTRAKVFFPVFFFYVCIKSTTTTTDNDAQTHAVLLLLLFAYYIILYVYTFAGVNRRVCGGNAICVCPVLVRKPSSFRYTGFASVFHDRRKNIKSGYI